MNAQDPQELFDLYDREGHALGRSKPRAWVHRDGDWHRSMHLWVVLFDRDQPCVVWQRRSMDKDTHPGAVDVSVAGHLRAGEGLAESMREAEEEIGLSAQLSQVQRLGVRARDDRSKPGVIDRELQDILVLVARDVAFASLAPSPDEVTSVLLTSLQDAMALCEGRVPSIAATELVARDRTVHATTLSAHELLPVTDGYFVRALRSIEGLLAGADAAPWTLRVEP